MQRQYAFFESKKLSRLSDYFPGYTHYFQETLWFLQQKFFGKLISKFSWVAPELLGRVYQIQQRQITAGVQKHLGEILLKNQSDAGEQIARFLNETGSQIVLCPRCLQYFYNEPAFTGMQSDCPQCEVAMEVVQPPTNIVLASLRKNFLQPYPLEPAKENYPGFLLVDIHKYLYQQPEALEQEIQLILQACDLWIDNIPTPEMKTNQKADIRRVQRQRLQDESCQDPLAVTNEISRQLIALNIFPDSQQQFSATPGAGHLSPLFCGYLQNLHELFWLLTQKIFYHLCQENYDLDAKLMVEALQLQEDNFNENMPLHLAEVLLGQHLLSHEQAAAVFTEMGYRQYSCRKCQQTFGQITASQGPIACPRCQASLPMSLVTANFIPWLLAIPCFRPLFLYKETEAVCAKFLFFKNGPESPLDFDLASQDMERAWQEFWRSQQQARTPDPESELDLAMGTSQELSYLMQSLDSIVPASENSPTAQPKSSPTAPAMPSKTSTPVVENELDAFSNTQSVNKGAISQEISRLMQSMLGVDNASDESIYDRLPSGVFDKCRASVKNISIDPNIRREKDLEKSKMEMASQMGISQEISRMLQSMDSLDCASDEAFYDRLAKSQERRASNSGQERQTINTSDPQEKLREIPAAEEHFRNAIPTAMEIKHPRAVSLERWPLVLATAILLTIGYLIYAQIWPAALPKNSDRKVTQIPAQQPQPQPKPAPETGQNSADNSKQPDRPTVPDSQPPDDQQPSSEPKPSIPEKYQNIHQSPSPLQYFLQQTPSEKYIAEKLAELGNKRALAKRDLETLKSLYQQYPQYSKLRNLTIWAAGVIHSEQSRQWLENLLQNSGNDSDQVYAVEALQKWSDRQSNLSIIQALRESAAPSVITTCIRSLAPPDSKDEKVYQALCNKFDEINNRDVHKIIIETVARMKIVERKLFFERVLLDLRYNFSVRKQALEGLLLYAEQENDNAAVAQILFNLSRMVQHPNLKARIQRALKVVTRH